MSGYEPTPEQMEAAKSRDARLRFIDEGFTIGAEMRDSPTIKALLAKLEVDSREAMVSMSVLSPLDTMAIAQYLVTVRAFVYVRAVLDAIIERAEMMVREVQSEDYDERHFRD